MIHKPNRVNRGRKSPVETKVEKKQILSKKNTSHHLKINTSYMLTINNIKGNTMMTNNQLIDLDRIETQEKKSIIYILTHLSF